jgi:hypothetical protein
MVLIEWCSNGVVIDVGNGVVIDVVNAVVNGVARGGQWIGLGRFGPKSSTQHNPRVNTEDSYQPNLGFGFGGFGFNGLRVISDGLTR